MAKSKTTKKTNKTKRTIVSSDNGSLFSASAILFAGACTVLLGAIQDVDSIKLLMVGFGSALLVVGGSLISVATRTNKK